MILLKIYLIGFIIAWFMCVNAILKSESKHKLQHYLIYCLGSWLSIIITLYIYFKE